MGTDDPANSDGSTDSGGTNVTGGNADEDSDPGSGEDVDPNPPISDGPTVPPPGSDAFRADGDHGKPCPTTHPGIGTDCTEAHFCLYGDSVRYDCREEIYCGPEGWSALPSTTCEQPPREYCPDTAPSTGDECTPWDGATVYFGAGSPTHTCVFSGGVQCGCFMGGIGKPLTWRCDYPPGNGCPTLAPNYGTPCDVQGRECAYGNRCYTGIRLICKGDIWVSLDGAVCGE